MGTPVKRALTAPKASSARSVTPMLHKNATLSGNPRAYLLRVTALPPPLTRLLGVTAFRRLNQSHDGTYMPCRSQACGFHLGFGLVASLVLAPRADLLRPCLCTVPTACRRRFR